MVQRIRALATGAGAEHAATSQARRSRAASVARLPPVPGSPAGQAGHLAGLGKTEGEGAVVLRPGSREHVYAIPQGLVF